MSHTYIYNPSNDITSCLSQNNIVGKETECNSNECMHAKTNLNSFSFPTLSECFVHTAHQHYYFPSHRVWQPDNMNNKVT